MTVGFWVGCGKTGGLCPQEGGDNWEAPIMPRRDSHPSWHARKIHKQTFKVVDAQACCNKRCQEWVMRTVWLGRKHGKAPRRRLLTPRLRVGNTLSNA